MSSLKILLTHGYFINEDEKEKEIMRPYVPLGILYISAWLEKKGFTNEIFDSTFQSFELLKEKILNDKPDVIAIYTNLMTKVNVVKIIRFIKSEGTLSHTRIVLGGPEVRNHAENFLNAGADYVVIGEGEQTMEELISAIAEKKPTDNIHGLALLQNSQLKLTPERDKIKNLDELPMPARTKVDMHLYFNAWKQKHGMSAISVNTMRGCPYTCKWCSRAVYGQSYRRRSPSHVVAEMRWIKENYAVDSIWFVDDVFTVSHKWLEEFKNELEKNQLHIPYECITRADRMNEEVIDLLKESGCFRVWIGAESGSQKIIDLMDRRVDVTQVRAMIQASKRKGIQAGTFVMVGYPGETEEDIFETIDHLKISDPDWYTITVAYPIKGTELYAEIEPHITKTLDWATTTDRETTFLRTYPREYYTQAVNMITHDVSAYKNWRQNNFLQACKHKAKSLMAYGRMKSMM
jgi:radical SAM superfamily enzyme YgiQ (UPF0313 family)